MPNETSEIKNNTESHHWFPRCVLKHWKDERSYVHRLSSNGKKDDYKQLEKICCISDAHSIKFVNNGQTDWDENFEHFFDSVDNNKGFPYIVRWLKDLEINYDPQKDEQNNLDILLECILSLIVRSPSFRYTISKVGSITTDETSMKINQRNALNRFKESLFQENKSEPYKLARGKFSVLFSNEQEFIFGDGFYHNFTSSAGIPLEPRIILPLLPNICIFYTQPLQCITNKRNPKLTIQQLTKDYVDIINQTTMVYSRDFVFYRSQKPIITEDFSCKKFLKYAENGEHIINAFKEIFKLN